MATLRLNIRRLLHMVSSHNLYTFNHHVSCNLRLTVLKMLIQPQRSLGFERITANALASVGAFIALLVVFTFAYISDRTGYRGGSVILAHVCYLIVLITARQAHPHVGKWSRWGLWTAVNSFAVGYHPVHNTWVQLNCVDAGERSIAIA